MVLPLGIVSWTVLDQVRWCGPFWEMAKSVAGARAALAENARKRENVAMIKRFRFIQRSVVSGPLSVVVLVRWTIKHAGRGGQYGGLDGPFPLSPALSLGERESAACGPPEKQQETVEDLGNFMAFES